MKQKSPKTDPSQLPGNRRLMDRLAPEPKLGRLYGVLATSYEMQPEFLETDFLPTLLGLGAWDDRNWTSRIALEKHLAELEAATILIDARPYRGRCRSLRVDVKPVFPDSQRILHAKVLLAVYEHAVRLYFGSANLTEPGYRRNREIAAALTASAGRPNESLLVREAVAGLRDLLRPWLTPHAEQLCALADERLAEWVNGEQPRQQWFVWGGGPRSIWQTMLSHWPDTHRVERITIVSPFWSEETGQGPVARFVRTLKDKGRLVDNAELRLLTEATPDKLGNYRPTLPESFAALDGRTLGVKASAFAVDPRVPPEEIGMDGDFSGTRSLHAKLVLLEGHDTSLAYLGSANFTNRGWGFLPEAERANMEAGLILRRWGPQRAALQQLVPATIGDSVPLVGAAAGRLALPEPSPEELAWPAFLLDVLLEPAEADPDQLELRIAIDRPSVAGAWRIGHLPAEGEASAPAIVDSSQEAAASSSVRISLTKSQLERLLREQEVHVTWWLCEAGRSFPVNVAAAAKTSLPISPGSGGPEEQHLIAYYQGRVSWEDLFPDPDAEPGVHDPAKGDDASHGVDTSRIQSYVVREFVEALKGIRDDLQAAALSTKASMRLALLGSVSPVALARRVLEAAESGERTATASGFQLVEILCCLDAAAGFPAAPQFARDWSQLVDEARQKILPMLDSLRERFSDELSGPFQTYAAAVRGQHISGTASA